MGATPAAAAASSLGQGANAKGLKSRRLKGEGGFHPLIDPLESFNSSSDQSLQPKATAPASACSN